MLAFTPSTRVRPSPFYDAILADGLASVTSYNHMLLPTGFGDPLAEYDRLVNGVSMWDVAAERQISLKGPNAADLAQVLSARDLSKCVVGQGKYVPICDHRGVLLNDPILLKIAEDEFWLSIADSGILFWARAVAKERGFDVEVTEADVAPLAVQGPKAADVVASLFGDDIRQTKHFWFTDHMLGDIPVKVARSGWSRQGGFEIYLLDSTKGADLWWAVKEAGRPYDIGPGTPNGIERIESGLLSWGGDTDDHTNPFEVRMGRFTDVDLPNTVIGVEALRQIKEEGPTRHQLGITFEADQPLNPVDRWAPVFAGGERVGSVTCSTWSPRLEKNIGFALISRQMQIGDQVDVVLPGLHTTGTLSDLPFI